MCSQRLTLKWIKCRKRKPSTVSKYALPSFFRHITCTPLSLIFTIPTTSSGSVFVAAPSTRLLFAMLSSTDLLFSAASSELFWNTKKRTVIFIRYTFRQSAAEWFQHRKRFFMKIQLRMRNDKPKLLKALKYWNNEILLQRIQVKNIAN